MTKEDFEYLAGWLYESVKGDYGANHRIKELAEGSYKPLKGVQPVYQLEGAQKIAKPLLSTYAQWGNT